MKLKVVRIVTASYVVPWHLNNTLKRITADFEVCVVGHDVSKNKDSYPNVKFIDIDINRKTSQIADGLALIALCKFFYFYKPDIVHSIMPKAGLLAALAGFICQVPIRIHTFTGRTWVARSGLSRYFYYLLDRLINSLNTVCLTDSFSQSVFLLEHKISHSGQPLPVLSMGSLSGVDVTRFNLSSLAEEANQLRANLRLYKSNFVFTFIARKTRDKGAIDILNAFASVSASFKDARLLFVGPDEDGEIERLHKTNPELFVNVIDVGHVSNHEVYLAITDVLCLPSYREGFGSIVIDAAAMGVPTIGSRIPGLTDSVVNQQAGMLFPYAISHEEICARPWRGFYLAHPTWMGRIEWFRKHHYTVSGPYFSEDQDLLLRSYRDSRFCTRYEMLFAYRIRSKVDWKKIATIRYTIFASQMQHFASLNLWNFVFMATFGFFAKMSSDFSKRMLGGAFKARRDIVDDVVVLEWYKILHDLTMEPKAP